MSNAAFGSMILVVVGLGGLALSLPSCSKSPTWSNSEWTSESGEAMPEPPALSEDRANARLGSQQVAIREQVIEGVPVQGSYIKRLSQDGQPTWAKTKFLSSENLPSIKSVRRELEQKSKVSGRMEALQKSLDCKLTGALSNELRWKRTWTLVFKRTCERPLGEAFEIVMNSRGKLISTDLAGASLTMQSQRATLYGKGPNLSTLAPVTVLVSTDPNYLSSSELEVNSDAGVAFTNLSQLQQAAPGADQFDMLQAYYYSTKALEWVAQHLKFQMQGLKLRTQVGFPNKSSVAFYFNKEVRIGAGDDVTFSHMAWDPSIVIHETMHGVIDALTHLPLGSGEGGSLQEALADTLTALQLDSPLMGETSYKPAPYQRTLDNQMKWGDKTGGLYHDSLILSGAMWEIKKTAGQAAAEALTIYLLAHLVPSSNFADVATQFHSWLKLAPAKESEVVETILHARGWL